MEAFREDLLRERTVVVTGGGSGLGRATAERLASLGARVAVLGRRPDPLDETVRLIRDGGGQALGVPCDVRDPDRVRQAFDRVEAELGPPDQLVNNAAGNFLCAAEDLSPNGFDSIVRIVLYGSVNCTLELGRRLIRAGRAGAVVSIVTTYAETGSAFVLPSAVAKAGVLAMTRSLAVEWATYRIRLNAVAPGIFPTEGMAERLVPSAELERQALRRVPAGRFGENHELTSVIAFLLSDAAPFQTGDLVTVDGGEALFSGQQFAGLAHLDRKAAKAMLEALRAPRK